LAPPAAAPAVRSERRPRQPPVRAGAAPAWAGSASAPPRRPPAPRVPRRVSGPSRGNARDLVRRGAHARSLVLDVLSALERLSRHRLLERLIRGRSWIGLLAFALIGIVTLQLALLKLNASVGRALEREAALQRENSTLSIENSELASADHVQARAAQLGMEFASSASLRFLAAHPGADLARAAAAAAAPARTASGEETAGASASSSGARGEAQGQAGGEAQVASSGEAPSPSTGEAPTPSTGEAPAASAGEASSAHAGAPAEGTQAAQAPSQAGSERPAGETSGGEAGGTQASPQG
jgi:cell division protein FtsL